MTQKQEQIKNILKGRFSRTIEAMLSPDLYDNGIRPQRPAAGGFRFYSGFPHLSGGWDLSRAFVARGSSIASVKQRGDRKLAVSQQVPPGHPQA